MEPHVKALIGALAETRTLLRQHGERFASARVEDLEARLACADWTAIESTVSEATGGMGSLRDRGLSAVNGDAITRDEEPVVNARLEALVNKVEQTARDAAALLGVRLVR
jgi:hypothetical protein